MSRILTRIKTMVMIHNQNYLLVICGKTGSGKSFSAFQIAKFLDDRFDTNHVVFTAKQFLDLVNSGKLRKGTAIVWDELGAGGMSARNWYSAANKAISYVMQTFRKDNLYVIFTVPSMSFIDIHVRKLVHAIIETIKIDYENEEVICKYFGIQHNPVINKTYKKYPRIKVNGIIKKITTFRVGKPDDDFIKRYEILKNEFTSVLNKEAYTTINKIEQKEISRNFNIEGAFEILKNSFDSDFKLTTPKIVNFLSEKGIKIGGGRARRLRTMWADYTSTREGVSLGRG